MVRGPVFICGGDVGTAHRRSDDCPNTLHDWPLPIGYTDADIEAHWRLRNRWSNVRCPDCRLYGWLPGRLTDANVRRPVITEGERND